MASFQFDYFEDQSILLHDLGIGECEHVDRIGCVHVVAQGKEL